MQDTDVLKLVRDLLFHIRQKTGQVSGSEGESLLLKQN